MKNTLKKGFALLLAAVLLLGTVPGFTPAARAASDGIIIDMADANPPASGTGWTYSGNVYTITGDVIVTGTSDNDRRLAVANGATATITLDNADIGKTDTLPYEKFAISLGSGANVTLVLVGDNYTGAIYASGATLTIDGYGSLTAACGWSAWPGIATNVTGTLIINGGTVTATGGYAAAGIGGSQGAIGGTTIINGGTITATGGGNAAAIGNGSGFYGNGGSLTINGGSVKASATDTQPKNSAGDNVYLNKLYNASNLANAAITDIYGVTYGLDDVVADANGYLYFWLPESAASEVVAVSADNGTNFYGANYQRAADNSGEQEFALLTLLSGTVDISGSPHAEYGATLTANTSALTATSGGGAPGPFSYQWKRDGADIPGATVATYTPVAADIGAKITVTVTAANCAGSVTSLETIAVGKALSGLSATGLTVPLVVGTSGSGTVDLRGIALSPSTGYGAVTYSDNSFASQSGVVSSYPTLNADGYTLEYDYDATSSSVGDTSTQSITITTDNYADITASVTFTVTAKTSVTIGGVRFDAKTYDGNAIAPNGSPSVSGGTAGLPLIWLYTGTATDLTAYSDSTPPTKAGTYNLNISTDPADFVIGSADIPFTIGKATLTFTADDKNIVVGNSQPTYTYTLTGFVGGDDAAAVVDTEPVLSCPTYANAANAYPIVISGAVLTSGAGDNYEAAYVNATLTVARRYSPPYTPPEKPTDKPTDPTEPTNPPTDIGGGSTVTTPEDKPPVPNPDGGSTLPGGGTVNLPGGGTIEVPPGTVISGDGGTITIPKGWDDAEIVYADGRRENVQPGYEIDISKPQTPLTSLNFPFADVNKGDWFYDDVVYVYIHGLFSVTGGDTFSPNTSMTRGMIVTVLYRLAGEPGISGGAAFDDVDANSYYAKAVAWAKANGIVSGVGDNLFAPDKPISRQDLTVILLRYANLAGAKLPDTREYAGFNDDADSANYAKDAIEAFFKAGVINGKGKDLFDPTGTATRAELAAMLRRFIEGTK